MNIKILKRSRHHLFLMYNILFIYNFQLFHFNSTLSYANETNKLPFEMMIESLGEPFHPFKARPDLVSKDFRKEADNLVKPVVDRPIVAVIPEIKHFVAIPSAQPVRKLSIASLPVLKVTGIFYKTRNPMVILNGNILGLGDRSEGVRILAIRKGRVEIDYNEFLYKLLLKD